MVRNTKSVLQPEHTQVQRHLDSRAPADRQNSLSGSVFNVINDGTLLYVIIFLGDYTVLIKSEFLIMDIKADDVLYLFIDNCLH